MFSESLKIKLKLRINDKTFEIPGGNIKECELSLHSFGFEGKAGFGLFSDSSKDELFSSFVTHDLIEIHLSVTRVHPSGSPPPAPLEVTGYVTGKSVGESVYREVKKDPVLQRYYEISFQDIPAVLWKQHFPVKLYTDKKMSHVLKDQTVEGINLEFDDNVEEELHDMIFLGLEKNLHGASFYDFLMWYAHAGNTALVYDYKDATLKLLDKKPAPKPAGVFRPAQVAGIRTFFPESIRYSTRILNVHSEKHQEIEILQDQSVAGITQDIVMDTALKKELDDRKKLETSKLKNSLEKIEMTMTEFPSKDCTIGTMVNFEEEHWSENNILSDKTFRVYDIQISADARDQALSEHYNADHAAYDMEMVIGMELAENPEVHLPPFKNPTYPISVEGKVVSESGEDTDKTYQIYSDEKTSQDDYTVHVPLWDLKVKIPFIPGIHTGHIYFPAFKHARVLLALYFDRAEIKSFLDWGEGSRLPMDTQGNHILFGHNNSSQTSMKHLYSEEKPVFTIKRTSDTDTEMIRMGEESIILQTKNED
jgi:hypothetical protein